MNLFWRHEADAAVHMHFVVPWEKDSSEGESVLLGTEAARKAGMIFQCLELGLREWIVIACIGPAVRLRNAEISQKLGNGF